MENVLVVDGYNLLFRAFYALPLLNAPDGRPTNAVHGFFSMLFRAVEAYSPKYVAVAFDLPGGTFRHRAYDGYKAGRKETPPELKSQIPLLREVLESMGIAVVGVEDYEADDIMGTLSALAGREGAHTYLVTGDKDSLQLADEHTTVLLSKRGLTESAEITPAALMETYGLTPQQMIDLKGLMGDNSDNLPGIPGVGEKTALKLLAAFGTLENVLAHPDEAPGKKLPQLLKEHGESARMSKWLATVRRDVPMDVDWDRLVYPKAISAQSRTLLMSLGLKNVCAHFEQAAGEEPAQPDRQVQRAVISSREEWEEARCALEGCEAVALSSENGFSAACLQGDTVFAWQVEEALWSEVTPEDVAGDCVAAARRQAIPVVTLESGEPWGVKDAFSVRLAAYVADAARGRDDTEQLSACFLQENHTGAAALLLLYRELTARMEREGWQQLYTRVERPLMDVLADMEKIGFAADPIALKEMGRGYAERLAQLEQEIYAYAGAPFNLNSPKQLGVVLFETLGLPAPKKTKTGYSTDVSVLEQLEDAHPIIPRIMEHRQLFKLKSTYADGLQAAIDPADGRIHTHFQQTVTATGRLSSTEPNLQNIPVRTALGREMRRVFFAQQPGSVLVDADYSQIELRILAHLSGDERFIDAFRSGADIHTRTAAAVNGVTEDMVTYEMRARAKAVNFGIVYGISDFGLARQLGIGRQQAAHLIDRYFAAYPGVKRYLEETVEQARQQGYVTTIMGRRRYIPELKNSNYNIRSFGERVAMNAPVQGTAADVIKVAMVRVHEALKGMQARLIMQVHDELIVECPQSEAEAVTQLMRREMENVVQLSVPLTVEAACGATWYDAK